MDIPSVKYDTIRGRAISLVKDFTDAPGGRTQLQGDFSGEEFRIKFLEPALREGPVTVDLDGALGLPASFLDEAFGPLAGEVQAKRLTIHLTDNAVAKHILDDCLAKHLV